MRIAYIAPYLSDAQARGGVGEKIAGQIRLWQNRAHDVRLFVMTPNSLEIRESYAQVFQYTPLVKLQLLQSFTRLVSKTKTLRSLIKSVLAYRPDVIYLRHGIYIYPMHLLFSIAPVVMELNTDDVSENRHFGFYHYWFNRLTRGFLLTRAAGLISVTHEIAQLPVNLKYGRPTKIIANGIVLEEYEPLPPANNPNPVITLIGLPGMAWHGVDKLLNLAGRIPGLVVNIVGYNRSDVNGEVPPNVHLHGFLDKSGVRNILGGSDVACGSLALHRKNMQEASPLKVREALAYGIPVILGYQDTDLFDVQSEYILQLPNTEDNVESHADQILSFASQMRGRRIDRSTIAKRIDQGCKEESRLAFLKEILQLHQKSYPIK
jgi:glycosyltransferase involved in cell wall biosynthesis